MNQVRARRVLNRYRESHPDKQTTGQRDRQRVNNLVRGDNRVFRRRVFVEWSGQNVYRKQVEIGAPLGRRYDDDDIVDCVNGFFWLRWLRFWRSKRVAWRRVNSQWPFKRHGNLPGRAGRGLGVVLLPVPTCRYLGRKWFSNYRRHSSICASVADPAKYDDTIYRARWENFPCAPLEADE